MAVQQKWQRLNFYFFSYYCHMMSSKSVYFLLLLITVNWSCKKDVPIGVEVNTDEITTTQWKKTSDFICKGEVFDVKKLSNNTITLLAHDYFVLDSNFNLRISEPQFQGITNFRAKNLSNPFYINSYNASQNKQYLIGNYFDAATGNITNRVVLEPRDLINIAENGYGILLDNQEDKMINQYLKLFLKTEFDTATSIGKQYNVLIGVDVKTRKKRFEKVFDNWSDRMVTSKKGYLLYHSNSKIIRFLDLSLEVLDTNLYQTRPDRVFSTDQMFYIQNNYGLFSTENGQLFKLIAGGFTSKRLLNNQLMYGVKENKPCILNLSSGTISFLPMAGLEANTLVMNCEAIVIDHKIILFTDKGVFQIIYKA